jgi:hypothetical protein
VAPAVTLPGMPATTTARFSSDTNIPELHHQLHHSRAYAPPIRMWLGLLHWKISLDVFHDGSVTLQRTEFGEEDVAEKGVASRE